MTWLEVEQNPPRHAYTKQFVPVRLALRERNGRSNLWVTITNELAEKAGWQAGTRLGLSVGRDKFDGWLRLFAKRDGRSLKRVGKSQAVFTTSFIAPDEWHGLACESTEAENFVPRADELLVQIPWDFSEIETAPADQQEAA
jgi:hypothetical protein